MRTFEHPNTSNDWRCPICGTSEDKPVVLVPIDGMNRGNNYQAHQYHLHCIDLMEYDGTPGGGTKILAMQFDNKAVAVVRRHDAAHAGAAGR